MGWERRSVHDRITSIDDLSRQLFVPLRIRDHGTRNTTNTAPERDRYPTSKWTLQQFREALPGDHWYRFVILDRDSIFSKGLDQAVTDLGVGVSERPCRHPGQTLYVNDSAGPAPRVP